MKHSLSYIKICTDSSKRNNYPFGNLYVITGLVEFRIPGYPGPSKELETEVRLMRGKIFRGKIRMYFSAQLYVVRNYKFKTVSVKY